MSILSAAGNLVAADGDLDLSFDPGSGTDARIQDIAVQPDGRIIIAGDFTTYQGIRRVGVARVHPDGTLDPSYDSGNSGNGMTAVAVQPDGKILIGGIFSTYSGASRVSIARANPDGSVDTSFNPGTGAGGGGRGVDALALLRDGKIMIAGAFQTYNGTPINRIARLNPDGSLDTTFNPGSGAATTASGTGGAECNVFGLAIQPDGKILISGTFTFYNGVSRNRVARLNPDGSLDTSFNPGPGFNAAVFSNIALQPDGKFLVSGVSSTYNTFNTGAITRINPDGSYDSSFFSQNSQAQTINVRPDGKIMIGGGFTTYGAATRRGIARLNPDGSLDTTFDPGIGATSGTTANSGPGLIRDLVFDAEGRILIGGVFGGFNGVPRKNIARLLSAPAVIAKKGPPLPATTGFTVNDSSTGFAVPPDSVLRLRVTQPSNAARLTVRVQTSTTPENEGSWTDLNNGSSGNMIFDVTQGNYVLNTTSHPRVANLYFRAISSAPANSSSISNVVGPFNLVSNAQHLGRTVLAFVANGPAAPVYFRALEETRPEGLSMRIQSSTSPGDEGNWTDLNDSRGGRMEPYGAPGQFYLDTSNYPAHGALYFRVVSSAPGYVDSPSRGVGPFDLINSPKPVVTVTAPGEAGFVGSEFDFPIVLPEGPITVSANASSEARAIKQLVLIYDGGTVDRLEASSGSRTDVPTTSGDHVVEAFAADELGVVGDAKPVYIRVTPAGGRVFNRVADGDWYDGAWVDQELNTGIPGPNDLAILKNYKVTLSQDVTVTAVSLNGGSVDGPGALTVTGTFTIAAGTLPIGTVNIRPNGTLLLANNLPVGISSSIFNEGTFTILGRGGIKGIPQQSASSLGSASDGTMIGKEDHFPFHAEYAKIENFVTVELPRWLGGQPQPEPPAEPTTPPAPPVLPRLTELSDLTTGGNIISGGAGNIISGGAGNIISGGAGNIISSDGASLQPDGSVAIISGGGGNIISSDGASLVGQDGGGLVSGGGGNITVGLPGRGAAAQGSAANSVNAEAVAAATGAGFVQTGGRTDLTGIRITGPVSLTGGVLTGSGLIDGNLTNEGGYIAPGNSAGVVRVSGNFTQTTNGSLVLELGGTKADPAEFDQLKIGGTAALGGKLIVKTINGFTPDPNTPVVPLSYGSATGSFASTSGNVQLDLRDTGTAMAIVAANPPAPKLLNIATRMRVEAGDNALIGGFIVTGSAAKKVIVRAIGPSLPLDGKLADPTLELVKSDGTRVFNNDWRDTQQDEITATTIPPSNDLEAAIVATLEPGFYSAVVRGRVDGTGVGLVEVYDLDQAVPSTLANISTRGLVQRGNDVMIGGLIIGGTQPAKVLVRAIGPSLAAQGVSGALQDPELELVDGNGGRISNDDWRAAQEAEIIASTVAPTNSREAAIVATLVPGFYTAIVRGKDGTTGVALVEAYNLQ